MPLDLQYDIVNDTPASASPVEANYNRIEQYINQEVITRDGVTAMNAQLHLVGSPVNALDAAPKGYVDAILPIGIILMYGGLVAPGGGQWALCNGAEMESAAYPEAYAVLGTRFVVGTPAAGRFNLPNLADRVPVGAGAQTTVGATGGSRDAVVPVHSHVIDHSHPGSSSGWDSPDHTHPGVDHLHGVDILTTMDGTHNHGVLTGAGLAWRQPAAGTFGLLTGSSLYQVNDAVHVDDGYHNHYVRGNSGAADRSLTTGGASVRHVHTTSTPAMTGRTGTEGVAVANQNMPPYLGVQYVIRIS